MAIFLSVTLFKQFTPWICLTKSELALLGASFEIKTLSQRVITLYQAEM